MTENLIIDTACSADAILKEVTTSVPNAMVKGAAVGADALSGVVDGVDYVAALAGMPPLGPDLRPAQARAEIEAVGSVLAGVLGHEVIDPHTERTEATLNPGELVGAATGAALGAVAAAVRGVVTGIHHCVSDDRKASPSSGAQADSTRGR